MFNNISFTLTSSCPMGCSYCPQDKFIKRFAELSNIKKTSLEDFKVMVANINHTVQNINFGGYTEAMLNPHLYEMMAHAKNEGYRVSLNTTLYGADEELLRKILDLNVVVKIHLSDGKLKVDKKLYDQFIQEKKKWTVISSFTDTGSSLVEDTLIKERQIKRMEHTTRAYNLEQPHRMINGPVECNTKKTNAHVVMPNGDMTPCSMDFSMDYVLGNLMEQTLEDIYNSGEMDYFLHKMTQGDPDFICNHCKYGIHKKS